MRSRDVRHELLEAAQFEQKSLLRKKVLMKKLTFVVGAAIGFVLGSRAGRGPYEGLENRARQLRGRPQVQRVTDQVGESAAQIADQVTESSKRVGDAAADLVSTAAERVSTATSEAAATVADRATDVAGRLADQLGNGFPINNYDQLTAAEITPKLGALSQVDLAKVDEYERKNASRSTVTDRIASLRGDEPWPGYDEQTVVEIRESLTAGDEALAHKVHEYERRHKHRQGVLDATGTASS
jgi:gas vesicle protein